MAKLGFLADLLLPLRKPGLRALLDPVFGAACAQMMTYPGQDGCNQLVDDGGDATLLIHKALELALGECHPCRQDQVHQDGHARVLVK